MSQQNDIVESVRGDALNIVFQVNGMDLTGKQARSQVKFNPNTEPTLTFSSLDGSIVIVVISPTEGTLTFSKTATQMANVAPGSYKYDIEVYSNVDDVITICSGILRIVPDITQ